MIMRTIWLPVLLVSLLTALAACDSVRTIIADFDIDGTVQILAADDSKVEVESKKLAKAAHDPKRLSPFPVLIYDGNLFHAKLIINSDTFRGEFINTSAASIHIRFDEASVSSNVHKGEIALVASTATVKGAHVKGKNGMSLRMPAMRLAPGERGSVYAAPKCAGLFPTGRLFGVRFDDNAIALLDTGVGNSIRMRIPIDVDGKRVLAVFDFKATQANVRSSYR